MFRKSYPEIIFEKCFQEISENVFRNTLINSEKKYPEKFQKS